MYEDVPMFDQETQYVVQQAPVDAGTHIYMGVEVLDLELTTMKGLSYSARR